MSATPVWNPLKLDWRVEQAKADRLELLYQRSGRADRSHPQHGLFTGLVAADAPSAQQTGDAAPSAAATPAEQSGAVTDLRAQ